MGTGRVRLIEDRGPRPAALRRHARPLHRRNWCGAGHPDREEGQAEPSGPDRVGVGPHPQTRGPGLRPPRPLAMLGPSHKQGEPATETPMAEKPPAKTARPQARTWSPPTGSPPALGEPEVSVVDGSFYLPALKRDAKAEYLAAHIPGAAFLRHRRHRRPFHRPAAHAAGGKAVLQGSRPRSASAGTTPSWSMTAAGLGGAPAGCGGPSASSAPKNVYILDGGLPKMEGRRPGRPSPGAMPRHAAAQVRRRAEHQVLSPASPTCRWHCSTRPPRWSTPGLRHASAARM